MEFDYKDPNTGEIKTDKGGNRWWQEENEKYIIDLMNSGEYTPDEWADLVGKYAQYSIGKNRDRNDGVYQGRFDKTLTEGKRDVTEKNGLWDKLVRAVGGENTDVSGVKKPDKKWQLPTLASKDSSIANKTWKLPSLGAMLNEHNKKQMTNDERKEWNIPSLGKMINDYNKRQQPNKIVEKAATKTAKTVSNAATKGATNAVKSTVDKVVSEALKNEKVKKAAKTETKSKKIASTSKKLTQQAKKRDSASKKKTTTKKKTTAKKTSTSSKSKKKAQSKKKTTTKKKKK